MANHKNGLFTMFYSFYVVCAVLLQPLLRNTALCSLLSVINFFFRGSPSDL